MRRGRSADNRRQGQGEQGEQGSQASHVNQPEELPLPSNPNEVIGTMATMIREQARARVIWRNSLKIEYVISSSL